MRPLSEPGWLARGVITDAALFLASDEITWHSLFTEPKADRE